MCSLGRSAEFSFFVLATPSPGGRRCLGIEIEDTLSAGNRRARGFELPDHVLDERPIVPPRWIEPRAEEPQVVRNRAREGCRIDPHEEQVPHPHAEVAEPRYVLPAGPTHDIVSTPTYVVEEIEPWQVNEPTPVEATESSYFDQTVRTAAPIVDPMPETKQTLHEPARKGTSATFEAALAAIRAAWVKPDVPLTILSPPTEAAAPSATAPGKVDPPAQQEVVRKTRPENRRREIETSEQRPRQDEWGIFDPDQGGFSAVVDKVAESKDAPPRSGTRRVISIR